MVKEWNIYLNLSFIHGTFADVMLGSYLQLNIGYDSMYATNENFNYNIIYN
jgi:hypothetical protein